MIHFQDSERLHGNSNISQPYHRNERQMTSSVPTRTHANKLLEPLYRQFQQRRYLLILKTLILMKIFLISTFEKRSRISKMFFPNSHIENFGTPLFTRSKVIMMHYNGLL